MEDSVGITFSFLWFGLAIAVICLFIGGAINQYLHLHDARTQKIREQDEKIRSLEYQVSQTYEQLNSIRRSISFYTSKLNTECTPCKKK